MDEKYFLSGEFHYFRTDKRYWDKILDRIKELHLTDISTYVPWNFHEKKPGEFDFSLLIEFLKITKEKDIRVIIKPGPFIYAEWENAGLPEDLLPYHKLHPHFLKRTFEYLKALFGEIGEYFESKGGNIIAIQLDNDIDPYYILHYEDILRMFQDHIEKKYENIQKLNRAWKTNYESFREVLYFMQNTRPLIRYLDFVEFIYTYVETYINRLIGKVKKLDVELPIIVNTYNKHTIQPTWRFKEKVDILGTDIHIPGKIKEDKDLHAEYLFRLKASSDIGSPYLTQFGLGMPSNLYEFTEVRDPEIYYLNTLSALASGVKGWNYYMVVDRDNWHLSPINETGHIKKDIFSVVKRINEGIKTLPVDKWERVCNLAIAYSPQLGVIGKDIIYSFYELGYDYRVYNLEDPGFFPDVVFYRLGHTLPRNQVKVLKNYVEKGGKLILFTGYPLFGELGERRNLLGLIEPHGLRSSTRIELEIPGNPRIVSSSFIFEKIPGTPIKAKIIGSKDRESLLEEYSNFFTYEKGREFITGYKKPLGKGEIIIFGVDPFPEVVKSVLKMVNKRPPIRSLNKDTQISLFKEGETYYVVIVNRGHSSIGLEFDSQFYYYQITDPFNEKEFDIILPGYREFIIEFKTRGGTVLILKRKNKV